MLKRVWILLLLIQPISGVAATGTIEEFLEKLPLENVQVLEREAFYSHIYEVMFQQPLDHKNPEKGYFPQRLYISHVDRNKPVVMVTEGYSADYYYTSEPAALLGCNQIIVEHRYFGKSVPDSLKWEYLDTWQAATDHHRIIEKFKPFYNQEWITTGISKGGQTAIFHSFYYPDDVDARIPYVAPLNNDVEDQRIYEFLDEVGSKDCRKKIHRFQKHALQRQAELIPAFKEFCEKKEYTFELVGGIEKAFEYCVLEYSFAFWQWGYASCTEIPGRRAEPMDVITHMNMVAGFDYFADEFVENYRPFFYQAYTEMGYYGYDLDEFRKYLKHVTDPGFTFSLPGEKEVNFNGKLLAEVDEYIKNEARDFIFIYGEYDTWSATAVDLGDNEESVVFYKKKGTHRTRIRNMPVSQQESITRYLMEYIEN